LQVPATHMEEEGEDERVKESGDGQEQALRDGGIKEGSASVLNEQGGERESVRSGGNLTQRTRESSASARPPSTGSDASSTFKSFGPKITSAVDAASADVLNLESFGQGSRPMTGASVIDGVGVEEEFDKMFDDYVADEQNPTLFDDKAQPLAERMRAAAELMDSITEKDGKLWLIKKMLQERERVLEKRFEKLKKDHRIAFKEMNQGGKVVEQGKLITDLSMQVEAHKKQIAHLHTQMSPDFSLYRALEKLEAHIDAKEVKWVKKNELLLFRSVLLQKRAETVDAKEMRVEAEKNRLLAIERSIVMAEKKLAEMQSLASRQREVADGVARVEEFEKMRKVQEDKMRERELRLVQDEIRVMKAKSDAIGLKEELDRKRIEMDVDLMDLRETAWREHKAKFPSIYTKKVMVSRHFGTDQELIMMEGHRRSHESLSPVVPKTAPIGLPIRYAPPAQSPSSPNSPLIAKYAIGNNALRPRTVLSSPSKPYSRALASGGLPATSQGIRPRDGRASPAKSSAALNDDLSHSPQAAARAPSANASVVRSGEASHDIMTLHSPVLAPIQARSPSRAGAMRPGSVFTLKDGKQGSRARSRGAPAPMPEAPGPWGSFHDDDASDLVLQANQMTKVPRRKESERATVHPSWTARAWGKEGASL